MLALEGSSKFTTDERTEIDLLRQTSRKLKTQKLIKRKDENTYREQSALPGQRDKAKQNSTEVDEHLGSAEPDARQGRRQARAGVIHINSIPPTTLYDHGLWDIRSGNVRL